MLADDFLDEKPAPLTADAFLDAALQSAPPSPDVLKRVPKNIGSSIMAGLASAGEASAMATGGLAAIADKVRSLVTGTESTELQDKAFAQVDAARSAQSYWSPTETEAPTVAEHIVNGLARSLPDLLMAATTGAASKAAPVALAMQGGMKAATEAVLHGMKNMSLPAFNAGLTSAAEQLRNGASLDQAVKIGLVKGASTDVIGGLPMARTGAALPARVATGGFIGGTGSEVQRAAENAVLPADQQRPFTVAGLLEGAGTGMMFGALPHPGMRSPDRVDLGYEPPRTPVSEAVRDAVNSPPRVDMAVRFGDGKEYTNADPTAPILNAKSVDEAIVAAATVAARPATNTAAKLRALRPLEPGTETAMQQALRDAGLVKPEGSPDGVGTPAVPGLARSGDEPVLDAGRSVDVAGRADGEPVPALPSRDVADSDKTIDAQRVAEGDAPALSPDVIPQPPGGIEAEIARIQAMRSAQQDSNLEQRGASPVAESQALPPSERSNLGVTPEQDGTAPILPTLAERLEAMRAKPNEAEADPVPYVAPQVQVTKPHPAFLRGSEALAEVSKSLGGISPDLLADLSERKVVTRTSKTGKQTQYITWDNPPAPGYGPLFRKGGTGDISEIARVLEEAGYIERGTMERHPQAGIRQAHDIIKAELREGGSTLAVGRTDAIDAAMRARHEAAMDEEPWDSFTFHPDDLETSGYHELDPAQRIETERLVREADGAGIDTERMKEDAARQTADDSDEAYHSAIQFAVRQALTESRSRTDGNDAKAASERDDGRGQVAIAPGEARGERATNRLDDAKGLTLAAHDAAELKAKTERESNAAALDKKAQIDREAEHFTLQADAPVEQRKDSTQSLFDAPRDDQERSNTREADTRIPARDAETQRVVEVRKRVSVLESVRKCLS